MEISYVTAELIMDAFSCAHIELVNSNEDKPEHHEEAEAYAKEAFVKFCKVAGIENIIVPEEETKIEAFVVCWDENYGELDAVFSTQEKAISYVKDQYERCCLGEISWDKRFDPDFIVFDDGYIQKHEVDTLPFLAE